MLALTAVLLTFQPTPSAAHWARLQIGGLEVIGKSPAEVSRTALLLHHALGWSRTLVPVVPDAMPVPLTVVATTSLPSGRSFFTEGAYRSYAVVDARRREVDPPVLGDLLRSVIRSASDSIPLWVEVGVAEFLASVRLDARGTATIGSPPAEHLLTLRTRAMLPMDTVLRATTGASAVVDPSQRSVFTAQAWAVVHYLTLGPDGRGTQIGSYVKAVLAGAVPEEAFKRTFRAPPGTLGQAVAQYVAEASFRSQASALTNDAPAGARVDTLTERDAWVRVADALVQAGDVDTALASSRELPAAEAQSSDVRGLVARARLAEGKRAEAIRIFAEVVADPDADDRWRYYYAAALLNAGSGLLASRSTPTEARRAAQELQQLRARHPGHANVLALLGVSQLEAANPGGAIKYLSEAFARSARHEYALLLGRARIAGGDTSGARRLLGDLAAHGKTRVIRDQAATLRSGIPEGPPRSPVTVPVYRMPAAGESQRSGRLVEISCAPGWIVFHLADGDGVVRLAAASFRNVEMVSYDRAANRTLTCGRRDPPEPVTAIWRPMANAPDGVAGFVTSIEFTSAGP